MASRILYFSLLGFLLFLITNGPAQAAPAEKANPNGNQTTDTPISPDTRIIGGKDAEEGQFPWQVAIVLNFNAFCGGSIIKPNWLLTAGHCTYKVLHFTITVGTIYSGIAPKGVQEPDRQTITSRKGIPHPLYKPNPFEDDNDVGLIELPEDLVFTQHVNAILLATLQPEYLLLDYKTARISGWGKTTDLSSVSPILKYTDLNIIPGIDCAAVYGDKRMDQKICCSTLDGHSTCNGDSGGPLIYRGGDGIYREIGIVSYGTTSCTKKVPVVFARVTSFLDFIEGTTILKTKEISLRSNRTQ